LLLNDLKEISEDEMEVEKKRDGLMSLTQPLQTLTYHHFSNTKKAKWENTVTNFDLEEEEVEKETGVLVLSLFKNMERVGEFDFIHLFSNKQCSPLIPSVFNEEITLILEKCEESVKETRTIFES
jgi:hypothetical protein